VVPTIPVYFDYASALCFIAARIGRRLEEELAVELDWRPVEITSHYPALKHGTQLDQDTRDKIARVSRETGVAVIVPENMPDSRAALQGAVFARQRGCFSDYHRRVFEAAFLQRLDLADRQVLIEIAAASRLPIGEFMMAVATGKGSAVLADNLARARRDGVVGYPTFFLGEFPLTGIQPFETMRMLFERHLERERRRH
jgi:predicted DsbA family dithiol-disulfide isomerase